MCDDIYAAGDIAHGDFGLPSWNARIEHWRVAEQTGRLAAMNMLGEQKIFTDVPYFWTYQFDLGLDYIGHADRWDEIIIDGDVAKQDFVACYVQNEQIVAVCVSGRSAESCAIMELLKRRQMPPAERFRQVIDDGSFNFERALREIDLP